MKNIWGKEFFIICTILIVILTIYRVFSFYRFKQKLKTGSIELIKLENYRLFSYSNLFVAICMLVILYQSFFGKGFKEGIYQSFYMIAFIIMLINTFIQPQNYVIISSQGFRKSYFRKLFSWDKIESIVVVRQDIFITVNKKISKLAIDDRSELNHFLVRIKSFRPDLYDKYLMNLNISG
jgi:hypothetical protein